MIQELLSSASSYLKHLDKERLMQAFEFAKKAHDGQFRKDGSPYITHPLSAAIILTDLHVDEDTLIACLLHDVPEDTETTLEDIERKFGKNVAFLVDGITKLSKVHYRNEMQNRQVESLKKLFLHTAQDLRIILIKLADRMHNMQTLHSIDNPEKRTRIAKETLEIFVPIANLLGVWELKGKMEDKCFEILYPDDFKKIESLVIQSNIKQASLLDLSISKLKEILNEKNIKYEFIDGRQKTYYSIFRKMQDQNKSFNEVYDFLGVRVVLQDIGQCYQVLGILHQHFTPKIGRLKDYIALPKSNGYQGIHTTVFGINGALTEFQIRTKEMHLESEYGIAAHYFYDSDKDSTQKNKKHKKYQWVKELLSIQKVNSDNRNFLENLKLDVFKDRIFVFTPKGDVTDLPKGARVLDFAYQVHTDIGNQAENALLNGQAANLWDSLKNGDTVFVKTSANGSGPTVEWFDWAQTNLAHIRIKEQLKHKNADELKSEASNILKERLELFGMNAEISDAQKTFLLTQFSENSWNELLLKIGEGSLSLTEVVSALYTKEKSTCVHVLINVIKSTNVLAKITQIMCEHEFQIDEIHSYGHEQPSHIYFQFTGTLHEPEKLKTLLKDLSQEPSVESVCRVQTPQQFGVNKFGIQ